MIAAALQAHGRDEVRAALEEVLARPELQPRENPIERWIGSFVEWLSEVLDVPGIPGGAAAAEVVGWILIAFGVALAAWLLYGLARSLPGREAGASEEAEAAERLQRRVADLLARAAAAERGGRWIEALRLHFFALVVGLGERGDLDYRDAWTNRELLERGDPGPEVARLLRPLVRELDAHSFGHLPAGPEDARRMAHVVERLLGRAGA